MAKEVMLIDMDVRSGYFNVRDENIGGLTFEIFYQGLGSPVYARIPEHAVTLLMVFLNDRRKEEGTRTLTLSDDEFTTLCVSLNERTSTTLERTKGAATAAEVNYNEQEYKKANCLYRKLVED